jgi:hypothetical protein
VNSLQLLVYTHRKVNPSSKEIQLPERQNCRRGVAMGTLKITSTTNKQKDRFDKMSKNAPF